MEGGRPQNASFALAAEESRVDMAVLALYPGGDLPHPKEETERIQKESALSSIKREQIAFSCLSLAHDYMHKNRQTYQQLAKEKSPQHEAEFPDVSGPSTYTSSVTAVVAAACLVVFLELVMFFVKHLPKRLHKASKEDCFDLDITQRAPQNETPKHSPLQKKGPTQETSKAADAQESDFSEQLLMSTRSIEENRRQDAIRKVRHEACTFPDDEF
ncbi:uncharacterized protein EMH_0009890 [Eimeria mitis]|uniref:Uncharacterized protein n=1 Tax=Eimeria mitis TaxID=44415 RepID=U6K645_9EIME|nr:uncharacterized protein EMH_0009890 [Eimeria mitis]CDJ31677.1 hypothetical protein, conserved [Eimeria mitis]